MNAGRCTEESPRDTLTVASGWRTAGLPHASEDPAIALSALPTKSSAEEILEEWRTAQMLAAIVQSSDDAIVSKDLNGIIQSWNRAAEQMFGYVAEEAIGQSIRTIIPADRQHEEDMVLARIRAGERVDHFETVRQRKDGSRLHVSLTVSPIRDKTGSVVGASKVVRDITARAEADAAVQRSIAIKDQFLSLVSHELRTPISVIVGNAHLLTRRGDTLAESDRSQALQDITFEAERLQRIIENLLLLTRVEAGDRLEVEPIHLERLVSLAVETVRRRSRSREIRLDVGAGCPPALGDATLVTMVLENLIGNADKYSPPDHPIDVRVGVDESGSGEVHVLDRGIGFGDNEGPGLFTPFYRTNGAKEFASGMGLGLAVCKRAIEEQGGSIGANQRPGGGADFWFSLPLAAETEADD